MKIIYQYQTKKRIYELTDHLGNVRAVIKREKDADNRAQIIKASDYYPFGMEMPGRKYSSEAYRYDYQGQFAEKDGETGLHSFEARLWDARIARWTSMDPVENFYSPYAGMHNNPLSQVDPDGRNPLLIAMAIGAAIGGYTGYKVGQEAGADGLELAVYILGGAAIGGLSGYAAGSVAAAGGSVFLSGGVGGAIGNGGFAALQGDDIAKGIFTGFVSGGVGASVGAGIGGGAGGFFGGSIGSGLNAKLNGSSWEDAGRAALAGGTMAFGTYHLSSYIGWKFQGGNKMGDLDISYRQYTTMQADFQRSRFWGKEYGGYLIEGGGVHRVSSGTSTQIDMGTTPNGAFAEYHTHWDKPNITRAINLDGNYINKSTHTGMAADIKTHRYHSLIDLANTHGPSIVINRYDGSYYSGSGNYSIINPPINRFIYSFFFWR